MYGRSAFTAAFNAPRAAILGVGAFRAAPALEDGKLVERRLITTTLTCDHRILYGADASQVLAAVRPRLEQPSRLTC